jgi:hypothetical protein
MSLKKLGEAKCMIPVKEIKLPTATAKRFRRISVVFPMYPRNLGFSREYVRGKDAKAGDAFRNSYR